MRIPTVRLIAMLIAGVGLCMAGVQEDASKPQESAPRKVVDGYFSGTVLELAADKITVTRTVLSKEPEKRTFLLNPETKVEGKLRAKIRVTVRYSPTAEGDIAITILVRDGNQKKK